MEVETPTARAAPHLSDPLRDAKRAARAQARLARAACDLAAGGRDVGLALATHVLRTCPPPPGAVVAGFWPIGDEIDLRPLLHDLAARGHPIVLPVTGAAGTPLTFQLWRPADVLLPERFGTSRPAGEIRAPDLLLVPLLAFDRRGNRLGYGGGYYDRTLAALPGRFALGCGFAAQEVDAVPTGPYDARLGAIATEHGVIFCKDT